MCEEGDSNANLESLRLSKGCGFFMTAALLLKPSNERNRQCLCIVGFCFKKYYDMVEPFIKPFYWLKLISRMFYTDLKQVDKTTQDFWPKHVTLKVTCALTKTGFTSSPFRELTNRLQANAKKKACTDCPHPEPSKGPTQEVPAWGGGGNKCPFLAFLTITWPS